MISFSERMGFVSPPDGPIKLDVRLQEGTVWLTQPMMAEMF